jgi:hypothetical protein
MNGGRPDLRETAAVRLVARGRAPGGRRASRRMAGLAVPTRVVFEEYTQEMYDVARAVYAAARYAAGL